MKYLREVNEYKIVCADDDDYAINNHTFLENYCLDETVCKSCPSYNSTHNDGIWTCKKYSKITKRNTVRVGGRQKTDNIVAVGGMLLFFLQKKATCFS